MGPAPRSLYALPDVATARPAAPAALRPVRRTRLVRRLADPGASLAVLVAPAGYGKTTLLRQWVARERRPHAWLQLIRAHDDAAALRAAVDEQLAAVEQPCALILDGLDALRDRRALAVVEALIGELTPGSIVAVASRAEPRLPLGRLRATVGVVELRHEDLRMDAREADVLVRRSGLHLSDDDEATLLRRTEGWPAGLRLASVALREARDPRAALARFGGDDRVVADYLGEQLAELSDDQRSLLVRTAPLDRLSGELCDAVLERCGTGRVLRELARSNVYLEAVDRSEEHFRAHPLLAEALRAELRRADPAHVYEVHRRASAWYEQRGDARRAIDHAIDGRAFDRAGELLWGALPAWWGGGCRPAIERWLARAGDREVAAHPALALVAAALAVVGGRRTTAERWVGAAERALAAARGSQPRLEAGVAVLRAAMGVAGAADMAIHADRALAVDDPDDPWRGPALLLAGIARHLAGDVDAARERLDAGIAAAAGRAPAFEALGLAQLALIALEQDDREEGADLALRAVARAEHLDADDLIADGLVHAAAAFAVSHHGEAARARDEADRARRTLAARGERWPWYDAQVRLALARTELRLSDAAAARALIGEASRAARRISDAVQLQSWVNDAWARADAFAAEEVSGHWTLTTAELRVLRFLPSHLSFREIAARLHVSANTVKTQAHAVYRKLDVSSRSEAVAKARAIGLVDA